MSAASKFADVAFRRTSADSSGSAELLSARRNGMTGAELFDRAELPVAMPVLMRSGS